MSEENPKEVKLTPEVILDIGERIVKGRQNGLSDDVIMDGIEKDVGHLFYWQCQMFDDALFEEKERGYWRTSYGYPKDGDIVMCPTVDGPKVSMVVPFSHLGRGRRTKIVREHFLYFTGN